MHAVIHDHNHFLARSRIIVQILFPSSIQRRVSIGLIHIEFVYVESQRGGRLWMLLLITERILVLELFGYLDLHHH